MSFCIFQKENVFIINKNVEIVSTLFSQFLAIFFEKSLLFTLLQDKF
jgi:hypothetical protein